MGRSPWPPAGARKSATLKTTFTGRFASALPGRRMVLSLADSGASAVRHPPTQPPAGPPTAAQLAALLRAAPGAVYRCTRAPDGRILWASQEGALAERSGMTTRDVAGRSGVELFGHDDWAKAQPSFARAFAGQAAEFTLESGGRTYRHSLEPVLRENGTVEAVVGAVLDATESERAGEDARVFASALSHDLRHPLTVARNYTAILRRRTGDKLDEEGKRALGKIDESLARMSGLMEDLLRLTECSRMELDPRDVAIGEVVAEIAGMLRSREPERRARVVVDDLALAWGDDRLVRVLVETILVHAWRGTRANDGATIEFGAREGDTYFLAVTGAGIAPLQAARLFYPDDEAGAAGLGVSLATVDCIVRRHGGRLWTEPVPGGAALCFTLVGPGP